MACEQLIIVPEALAVNVYVPADKLPLLAKYVPLAPAMFGQVLVTVASEQIPPPAAGEVIVAEVLSAHKIIAGITLATLERTEATLALSLALFKLTNTIDAKIPMMAMTIKSSIRVKPFIILFFIFSPAFLACPVISPRDFTGFYLFIYL